MARLVYEAELDLKADETIQKVWEKGRKVPNRDPKVLRVDDDFRIIRRKQYGKESVAGWELDHIIPSAIGGRDVLSNLRPLHWESNRRRGAFLKRYMALVRRSAR